jgi:hypothetical protein
LEVMHMSEVNGNVGNGAGTGVPRLRHRRGPGRPFQKGVSGNPGGRPKELQGILELARQHAPAAMDTLLHVAKHGQSEAARVSAAIALLDRGFGKPNQSLDASITRLTRRADEMTDDELAAIAAGGGDDAAAPPADPQ